MKQFFLLVLWLSVRFTSYSQTDTMEVNVSYKQLDAVKKTDGKHVVTEINGIKLYAIVRKGQIQEFSATSLPGDSVTVINWRKLPKKNGIGIHLKYINSGR